VADASGTEEPTRDSAEGPSRSEIAPGSTADSGQRPWSDNPAERTPDEHEAAEQIRRTDADRWAASFAHVGPEPETSQGQDSDVTQTNAAGNDQDDAEDGQPADSSTTEQGAAEPGWTSDPSPAQSPSWPADGPVSAGEPSWRSGASGSGWRAGGSTAAHAHPNSATAAPAWTTDVPSGFSWNSESRPSPAARPPPGPTTGADQSPPGIGESAQGFDVPPPVHESVPDHVASSLAASARTEQALPPNPPPPPPPPGGYPSPPAQVGGQPQYGSQQYGGPYIGQQRSAPGPPSQWPAEAAVAPDAAPPRQWQPQPAGQPGWQPAPAALQHSSAADLTTGSLVKATAAVPRVGWRRMIHSITGGTVNPGLSSAEAHRRNLVERATAPVRGCHRIAVVSLKGGIGKTTTTAGLGLTLAEHRGDRVVALDANPDAGTLADRLTGQVDVTVRDLLDNADSIRSFTDVSAFTSLAARLQVLASEQDPEMSEAFSEAEYCTVSDVLARYFNIVLTDSGTGLLHSAMSGTLALADSLVVVGSPSVDGASRASKTLDWLIAHGHGELVSRSVAVISTVRPATKELDMIRLREHFTTRARSVVEIPYDRHLVTGGIIDISQLERQTEQAFLELAATVADGFRLPPLARPVATGMPRSRA